MCWYKTSLTRVRHGVLVKVGLNSSWTTTFCSAGGNFRVRSLALSSLRFLVMVVKPVSRVLVVITVTQEAGAGVAVVEVRVRVP